MNLMQALTLLWRHKKKVAALIVAGASGFVAVAEYTPTQKDDPIADKVERAAERLQDAVNDLDKLPI